MAEVSATRVVRPVKQLSEKILSLDRLAGVVSKAKSRGKRDIEVFCPLVAPGGWLFVDDFFSAPRVQTAWLDSTDPSQWRLVKQVVRMAHMERMRTAIAP